MENLILRDSVELQEAKRHVMFHHYKASGWITLAKKEKDDWKQYHYQPEQLAQVLSNWLGENVYFSQNTFYKPQRRIENIRQLRALYVDIDCHTLNYDPKWVLEKINLEVFQEILPVPNIIIFSGRGLVCIWLIEPVPFQALPLWKAIQNYFYEQLVYVGADKKSLDPTRVFRVAGSTNSKSGKRVTVEYRHQYRYVLRELQEEYLPELSSPGPRKARHKVKAKILNLYNIHNLHYTRLLDLVKLAELRNYDLKGNRELFCFLYRYWGCCFTDDLENALAQMLEFNSEFKEPLPKNEVIRATRSAEKAWKAKSDARANEEAISKGYPGAGYNLKNKTIIKWLNIVPKEQKFLRTIIDWDEKLRRKRERDRLAFRQKNGSVSRGEYLEQQKEKSADKQWQLMMAIKRHPNMSNLRLAKLLGVSESYIRKLKNNLDV
ncbi:replication protein [Bacillus massilinigeriensis]|uniref:replication protein n=1 Tax=Bacillus massilionigeriensis TaxID=1805475 RepID=UPI00096AE24F|nr:replication protein [Bacillus massilionigeriensis]